MKNNHNARFSILQGRAVRDRRISDAQFRTLAALGTYSDEEGWCWPSLSTLGDQLGKKRQVVGRDVIALKKLGYLEVYPRYKNNVRLSNKYRLKFDLPPLEGVSPSGSDTLTPSEGDTVSPSEGSQNDPLNDPLNRAGKPAVVMTIENKIAAGLPVTEEDLKQARLLEMKGAAELVAMGVPNAKLARDIALAFMEARDLVLHKDKAKGQRKAVKSLIEQGVTAEHVRAAVLELVGKGLTVTDLYSVEKTAVHLANKPVEQKPAIHRAPEPKQGNGFDSLPEELKKKILATQARLKGIAGDELRTA
jgi:hypothetical protein